MPLHLPKKVLATFPETMEYLPAKKSEYVGAVVREELFKEIERKDYNSRIEEGKTGFISDGRQWRFTENQ